MVGEAIKGGRLAAEVLSREGYTVIPAPGPCAPWSFITGEGQALLASLPPLFVPLFCLSS